MIGRVYKLLFIFVISILSSFFSLSAYSQIAVLNSNVSAKVYSNVHLGDYSDLWKEVIYVLDNTNLKYDILSEDDLSEKSLQDYEVLVLPLILDLKKNTFQKIEDFIAKGGKILVIFPDAYQTSASEKLAEMTGVQCSNSRRIMYQTNVNWLGNEKITENIFPDSTKTANIKLLDGAKPLAVWGQPEENIPAVTASNAGAYIGWKMGNDGNLAFNISILRAIVNNLIPGIIKKEQAKLDYKDFLRKYNQVTKFQNDTNEFLESLGLKDQTILAEIQEHLYLSQMQQNLAKTFYDDNDYDRSQEELKKAKMNALTAFAKSVPSSSIEGRTLWLDRGSVVSIKTPEEMAELFDKIKKIGINMVYFETVNAGYSIYPSKILEQNPLTLGWDPLYWAVKEAHKNNIEIHAWTWVFAVGNTRHNPIIGKSYDYSGPVLSKNYSLALLGAEGNFIPTNQHEYWIDPANPKARNFALSVLEEMVRNYDIDGVQLDYIRYPFQRGSNQMGFDVVGRQNFEIETGYNLDNLDESTLKAWNSWKTKQISKFVGDASQKLRAIKPDLKISAAVFGGDRQRRLSTIQQDWETWVNNGWVDILNPMIYSSSTSQLNENLDYIKKAIGNKALVYPGIAIRQLEEDDILEQIYTIKDAGLIGNTIFAMAHLGPEKSEILSSGPYRLAALTPSKNPVDSAKILMDEFSQKIDSIKSATEENTLYGSSSNVVDSELKKIQDNIQSISQNPNSDVIEKTILMLKNLECLTQDWLCSDKQIKPKKIKLLTDYIDEAQLLLTYYEHRLSYKQGNQSTSVLSNTYNVTNPTNNKY